MKTLSELLAEATALFPKQKKQACYTYDFELAKFPSGWCFNVINDWHKWMGKKLETRFGVYASPENAVSAFLAYVKANKINVKRLAHK